MPEIVKQHFEERRGYANYYFNRLNRDRVWKAWAARGDFTPLDKPWVLTGPLEGGKFRFELASQRIALALPKQQIEWPVTDELASSLAPPNSGGLFAALYLWRRLAVGGPDRYGEVYYLGTAPFPSFDEPLDVLVGLHGGVECRYYFDTKTGLLAGLEMYPEENADPCEVYFSEYGDVAGRQFPHRIEVRFGNETFAVFRVEAVEWGGK